MAASTETLLVNGRIFQANGPSGKDQQASFATSLLIGADGTIKHINTLTDGEDETIQAARANGATIHDLQGRTVLPGFFDGHVHLLLFGLSLQKVDLTPCTNLDEIRATIKAFAAAHPELPRIMAKSWRHTQTPDGIHHSMLDDLDPRPIYVDSKDLHSVWANQAGIDELDETLHVKTIPSPPGGTIHRDADGKSTGHFEESVVFTMIWPWLSSISTLEERTAAVEQAIETYNSEGYVGITELGMNSEAWECLVALKKRRPDLPIRLASYWFLTPSEDEANLREQVRTIAAHAREWNAQTSPDLRVAGIKIVTDGIVDSCTAALAAPYSHNEAEVPPVWTKEMLLPAVDEASKAGIQVAIHAIGDLTVRNAIDVIEAAVKPEQRPRIEHLELSTPEDAARLGKLGITASVQPVHSDPAILRAWPRLIGEHRCGRGFAYREFADGGATLALGSDAPTAPHGVAANCYVATTRRSAREPENETTFNAHFALGLCESIVAASRGSAYTCFMEDRTGSIEKGLNADLTVLDMAWDKEELLKAKVVETWFAGRQVFARGE